MTEPKQNEKFVCPICGTIAEYGCIYGPDNFALRWVKGNPSFGKNIKTAIGGGEIVGESPLFKGSYVKGIRCNSCEKIIVDLNGYPDPSK